MTKQELIKQAYAYGAAVALQELGYNTQQAQATGVKLAEDGEGMNPAIAALLGGGAGALGGAALGAGSALIPGMRGAGAANWLRKGRGNLTGNLNPSKMHPQSGGYSPLRKAAPSQSEDLIASKFRDLTPEGLYNAHLQTAQGAIDPLEAYVRGTAGGSAGLLGGGLIGGLSAGE